MNKIKLLVYLFFTATTLNACASMSTHSSSTSAKNIQKVNASEENYYSENISLKNWRENLSNYQMKGYESSIISAHSVSQDFRKLPNPELHLYIAPHLSGKDQLPVPGYTTVFNVYDHDHYGLAQES